MRRNLNCAAVWNAGIKYEATKTIMPNVEMNVSLGEGVRRLPVYFLLDCSGSMAGAPIEAVRPNPVPQIMAKIIVEIPDARLPELPACQTKLGELLLLGLSQMKIQESLFLYQRGLISFARAAELAGVLQRKMIRQARAFGISPRWDAKMIEAEVA